MTKISCADAARNWGMSARNICTLCAGGKIPGAEKIDGKWTLPADARRPEDNRVKSGRYTKSRDRQALPLPIGVSDFRKAQEEYYYVDKTLFIKEFLDRKPHVSLFTRPRRFGKTLNMDMVRVFFEKTDSDTSIYFRDKKIWKCGKRYTRYQGQYPVIFLSFKDVKYDTWDETYQKIQDLIQTEFSRHSELRTSDALADYEKEYIGRIVTNKADYVDVSSALLHLSRMLAEHHGKNAIIIVDEYDTPIQEGFARDYYDSIVSFMRNFFSSGLKDNPYLEYGFLTGILRIAQESIFSGLNNLDINTVLDPEYSQYFGFTREEVLELLSAYRAEDKYQELTEWYDGYRFGDTDIFNPWSVISYISKGCTPRAYWINTGRNEILDEIIKNASSETMEKLSRILQGESIVTHLHMDTIYPSLRANPSYIYSFLLVAGYLKLHSSPVPSNDSYIGEVSIPNKEIRSVYKAEILNHLYKTGAVSESSAEKIAEALYLHRADRLKNAFQEYLLKTISFYDASTEGFFHGFLAGVLSLMDDEYRISSNRESGKGRYDLCLIPRTRQLPGIILELKYQSGLKQNQLEALAEDALSQINEKQYATDLTNAGVDTIIKYGIAFSGKDVHVVSM